MEIQKLISQSYTNRTNHQNPKQSKDPAEKFYARLHNTLKALQKIQQQLPRETWQRFITAYTQHWLYSLEHGEHAAAPANYYNEWAEVQSLGAIPMDTDTSVFHAARNYHAYESPRERARKALGLDAEKEVA